MGQLISQFDEDPNTETHHTNWPDYANWGEFREMKHRVWLPEQDREARQNYKEYTHYSNVTTTVFVIVMIILLMVLLICCIKTVMVCRRQKKVNDQRRRIMQRQAEAHRHHNYEPRQFTIHQSIRLPGGGIPGMYLPEDVYRHDEPPAYDQVIGLPPSYDSVIILNGVATQSRGASVVGSVRNSVLGTVRSLRRSSQRVQCCPDDDQSQVLQNGAVEPSEIGSAKSESLIASVSNQLVLTRYPMSEPEQESVIDESYRSQRSRSTKSLRRNKSTFSLSKAKSEAEDEESLTGDC